MFGSLDFFLCHEEFCHHVYSRADTPMLLVEEVPELFSDHEEADTRLLLHAKHASQNHSDIIIKSPDPDVFVLCVAKANEITGNLLFETGAKERNRIVCQCSLLALEPIYLQLCLVSMLLRVIVSFQQPKPAHNSYL